MPRYTTKKGDEIKTIKPIPKAAQSLLGMKNTRKPVKGKADGGKLKMVEKNGKKVPFYAADGVGKMASGGSVKVKSGDTLSQIAKSKGITLKSLLAANPNIKNANMIRVGQSIRIPGAEAGKASKSSNPYKGMTKTQMNMMDVKNKDRGKQEAATRSLITQSKMGTGMTPSKPAPKTDAQKAMDRARAKMKNAPKKAAPKKSNQSMSGLRDDDVAAKKGGYMKKYQSGGKTSSEAERLAKMARVKKPRRPQQNSMAGDVTTGLGRTRAEMEAVARGGAKGMKHGGSCRGGGAATRGKKFGRSA